MLTTRHRLRGAVTLTALAILATASATQGQQGEEVVIGDTLEPARIEVPVGTTVTWQNDDGERHRIRSRRGPVEFDSGNLEPGEQFSVTFVVAGEYPYLDERNDEDPTYFGTVVVTGEDPTDGPPPTEATVTLIDESFQPPSLEVAVGATITWANIDGDDDHTVTSVDGAFNSGVLPAGDAFQHTFADPGTYDYFCAIHPEMEGTVTVVGAEPAATRDTAAESPGAAESPSPVESPGEPAVSIVDLAFQPTTIEVERGASVIWTNDDGVSHTATARDGSFASTVLATGDTFSQTFDELGTYDYFCAIHPEMSGTVVVTEAGTDVVTEPAASGSEAAAGVSDAAASSEVSIVNVMFDPADIEVAAGSTVVWVNDDPFEHTVSAREQTFDSGVMGAGDTFRQTFDAPGSYDYFCAIHPSMTGTITVTVDEGG